MTAHLLRSLGYSEDYIERSEELREEASAQAHERQQEHNMNRTPSAAPAARPLYKIAADIRKSWKTLSPYAKPYVDAMAQLNNITDTFGVDSAQEIVLRFLSNASGWRGETAQKVKAELRAMAGVK